MKAEAPAYLEGSGAWQAWETEKQKRDIGGKVGTQWRVSSAAPDDRHVEVTLVVRFERDRPAPEAKLVPE